MLHSLVVLSPEVILPFQDAYSTVHIKILVSIHPYTKNHIKTYVMGTLPRSSTLLVFLYS